MLKRRLDTGSEAPLLAEEIDQEFGVGAVSRTCVGHFGEKKSVALAPKDSCGNVHRALGERSAIAEESAIPVDHGGERAGLRPGGAILGEVVGREGTRPAGAEERPRA